MQVQLLKIEALCDHYCWIYSESPHFLTQAAPDPQVPSNAP